MVITQHVKMAHDHEQIIDSHYRQMAQSVKVHGNLLGKVDGAIEEIKKSHNSKKHGHVEHHMQAQKLHAELVKIAASLEESARSHSAMALELRRLANTGQDQHRKAVVSIKAEQSKKIVQSETYRKRKA